MGFKFSKRKRFGNFKFKQNKTVQKNKIPLHEIITTTTIGQLVKEKPLLELPNRKALLKTLRAPIKFRYRSLKWKISQERAINALKDDTWINRLQIEEKKVRIILLKKRRTQMELSKRRCIKAAHQERRVWKRLRVFFGKKAPYPKPIRTRVLDRFKAVTNSHLRKIAKDIFNIKQAGQELLIKGLGGKLTKKGPKRKLVHKNVIQRLFNKKPSQSVVIKKLTQPLFKKKQKSTVVHGDHYTKLLKGYFGENSYSHEKARRAARLFKIGRRFNWIFLRLYKKRKSLSQYRGVYVWAILQKAHPRYSWWDNYTRKPPLQPAQWAKYYKQSAWIRKKRTLRTKYCARSKGTELNRLYFSQKQSFHWRFFRKGLKTPRAWLSKKKYQVIIWRRVIRGSDGSYWKHMSLYYKFQLKAPSKYSFSIKGRSGYQLRKRVFKTFRTRYARIWRYQPWRAIQDITELRTVRQDLRRKSYQTKAEQYLKPVLKAKSLGQPANNSLVRILNGRRLKVLKRLEAWEFFIKKRKWTLPKTHDAKTVKALAIFNKAFPSFSKEKTKWKPRHKVSVATRYKLAQKLKQHYLRPAIRFRPRFVRWYKLHALRYNLFKPILQWRGFSQESLVRQGFKRLNYKWKWKWSKNPKLLAFFQNRRKQPFMFRVKRPGFKKLRLQQGLQKTQLQRVVNNYLPKGTRGTYPETEWVWRKPCFFSLYTAAKAFDFNKFFKVNKTSTRVILEISQEFYTRYFNNLSALEDNTATIIEKANIHNVHTARVLRKYMKLLRSYFNEVYDNKMAKTIPAASAMHWIREYLYLTSSIHHRAPLWNRFDRVTFHFKPKAKEKVPRSRKKKILFKSKILFDRLFKWIYDQPNARYALAAPIQKTCVSEYLVRNQFIFKKQFKIRLSSKFV